jgi:hypothetical protein
MLLHHYFLANTSMTFVAPHSESIANHFGIHSEISQGQIKKNTQLFDVVVLGGVLRIVVAEYGQSQ